MRTWGPVRHEGDAVTRHDVVFHLVDGTVHEDALDRVDVETEVFGDLPSGRAFFGYMYFDRRRQAFRPPCGVEEAEHPNGHGAIRIHASTIPVISGAHGVVTKEIP